MNIPLWPRSRSGRLSLLGVAGLFVFYGLLTATLAAGSRGDETFFVSPLRAVLVVLALGSCISAFGTGLFSLVKRRERSVLVILTTLIGLFVLMFVAGEFISPH